MLGAKLNYHSYYVLGCEPPVLTLLSSSGVSSPDCHDRWGEERTPTLAFIVNLADRSSRLLVDRVDHLRAVVRTVNGKGLRALVRKVFRATIDATRPDA